MLSDTDLSLLPAEAAYADALACAEMLRPVIERLMDHEPALAARMRAAGAELVMSVATAHGELGTIERGCAWAGARGLASELGGLTELCRLFELPDDAESDARLARAGELLARLDDILPRLLVASA